MSMGNLPDEVLSEIFIRLLSKQLAQMRSVCKPWNALISESSFIKSHLHRSIQNNDDILLFSNFMFSFEHNPTPFTARLSRSPDLELANFIKPPVFPKCKFGCGTIIGSVNGLICFACKFYRNCDGIVVHIYIWNPSLSAMLTLPPCPRSPHHLPYGFGFDPKTDDYKVLKLTSLSGSPNKVKQAEVYSMRNGSWKLLSPQSFPSHIPSFGGYHNQVCVNDNLHWLCHTDFEWKPQTIVGFDLGADTFSEISFPETILDFKVYKFPYVIGVLGGKLCVMSCVRDGGKCEVWVMDEYGVPESWVKHRVFSQFSGDIVPYGFTLKNEFLFQVDKNDNRFGLFEPVAAKTKTFKIMSRLTPVMKFVEYVDSLVWVPPPNRAL